MTVEQSDTIDRETISGTGPYTYSFRIFDESELVVYVDTGDLDPVELTLSTHYSVSGVNDEDGGTITLTAQVASDYAGDTLDIRSNTVSQQPTSIRNQGRFLPEIHEDAFDRLQRQIQDLQRRIDRKFGYPDNALLSGAMASRSAWAEKVPYVNSSGVIEPATSIVPQALSASVIGDLVTPRSQSEINAGVLPTNKVYPVGHVYRYGNNTVPSTTDMTAAINTAADVCREGGHALLLPAETCLFSSTLDFSGITVQGPCAKGASVVLGPQLQASSAVFNCIISTGNSYFRDFFVHGGWDGSTAGLGGDIFHFMDPLAYNIHLDNVTAMYAKRSLIRWSGAAYSSIHRFRGVAAGNHGLEFDDTEAINTTVTVGGNSQFSSTPNGYGIAILGECHSMKFSGLIIEDTGGIVITDNNCRTLEFNQIYQENFTNPSMTFLDCSAGSVIGLTISNCIGINREINGLTTCNNVYIFANAGIRETVIPDAGRVVAADSDQQLTSTTGGVNLTVTSVVLPPGLWLVIGTLQTVQNTATGLTSASCCLTTSSADAGLQNAIDVNFKPGAAEARYTPEGGAMDQRLNPHLIYRNATTGNVTLYLRATLSFTGAGNLGYRGRIDAVKL